MFLLLNALVASFDSLIIGISLKIEKTILNYKNFFILFISNIIIYLIFLKLYLYLNINSMTKTVVTILYLILAYRSLTNNDKNENIKKLTVSKTILLALVNSLDGILVSLQFVSSYKILCITTIFSFASILFLIIGYYFAILFKKNIANSFFNSFLFICLAILNQCF